MLELPRYDVWLWCLLTLLLWTGCEEQVVQPEPHAYPFSMWGVLNPMADTQFVRVFPIEPTINARRSTALDARFVSIDLDTGDEWVWRDSTTVDSSGAAAHLFYTPHRTAFNHRYRIELTRSDGAQSWVEVTMPGEVRAVLGEPDTTSRHVILPAFLEGEQPRLMKVELQVSFYYLTGYLGTPPFETPLCHFVDYVIPYADRVQSWPAGRQVRINLTDAYRIVRTWVAGAGQPLEASPTVMFNGVMLGAVVGNAEWDPPGGVFDERVLVQPGVMENVENGFGFVAGGYRLDRTWSLDADLVSRAGFAPGSFCEVDQRSVVQHEGVEPD